MSSRFYKVIKDNFLWEVGAIITHEKDVKGYRPIEGSTLWDKTPLNESEYISARIVENCPEFFLEVFPVNLLTKTVYKIKSEALEAIESYYK